MTQQISPEYTGVVTQTINNTSNEHQLTNLLKLITLSAQHSDETVIVAVHRNGNDIQIQRLLSNRSANGLQAELETIKVDSVDGDFSYACNDFFTRCNEALYPDLHRFNDHSVIDIGNIEGEGISLKVNHNDTE